MVLGVLIVGELLVVVVKLLGLLGEVNVVLFDLLVLFLELVIVGDVVFVIDQQQFLQGYLLVNFLVLYVKYGLMLGGNVLLGLNLIIVDKVGQVVELLV